MLLPVISPIRKPVRRILGIIIAFYLVSAVAFVFLWMSARSEADQIRASLASEEQLIHRLSAQLEQMPALEKKRDAIETELDLTARRVPRPENLGTIVTCIEQAVDHFGLHLEVLNYAPLDSVDNLTYFPLDFSVQGSTGAVRSFWLFLAEEFPSLRLTELSVWSDKSGYLRLGIGGRLAVLDGTAEDLPRWEQPTLADRESKVAPLGFGLPFNAIESFLRADSVQLRGIVLAGGRSRALLYYQGRPSWYGVGEAIGQGEVTSISAKQVVVTVSGVELEIKMDGGQAP